MVNVVLLEFSSSRLVVPNGPTHERPRAVLPRQKDRLPVGVPEPSGVTLAEVSEDTLVSASEVEML